MNLRQVDAEDRMRCGPRIEGWRSGRFVSITSRRQLVRGFGCNVSKAAQDRLDPQIALHDLGVVVVVKLQRPSEGKDVLLTPVSGRRGSDLLLRGMAARSRLARLVWKISLELPQCGAASHRSALRIGHPQARRFKHHF